KESPAFTDRPVECYECKKPIDTYYTEVVGTQVTRLGMCVDCPVKQERVHGTTYLTQSGIVVEADAGLACGECGTVLNEVRRGHTLGCEVCYDVFGDVVIAEMEAAGTLPRAKEKRKKRTPLHIGRAPGETQEINPSLRLLVLNEALTETLKREDYEQAAWLRDQIKALTEKENSHE
ncbi:MAG: UvrB/UvrC motif-containing protein, partial [Chlamydiia bacterium]|nr:UvrB/UvrC motif-containing protein [Chlamydiia bacterium]